MEGGKFWKVPIPDKKEPDGGPDFNYYDHKFEGHDAVLIDEIVKKTVDFNTDLEKRKKLNSDPENEKAED